MSSRAAYESYVASYTVPVALRLVGNAVRVLPYTYVLNAVVDTYLQFVACSELQKRCNIVTMRYRERRVAPCKHAVHIYLGLYMRTFKKERHTSLTPVFRHIHMSYIPCFAHVMARWSEKEGEFHLACLTVFGEIRIEIERRVVECSRPAGIDRKRVANTVGKH